MCDHTHSGHRRAECPENDGKALYASEELYVQSKNSLNQQHLFNSDGSVETLCRILKRLARMDLPGKDHVAAYLPHLIHRTRRPRTLESRCGALFFFLGMIWDSGNICVEEVAKRVRDCLPEYFSQADEA